MSFGRRLLVVIMTVGAMSALGFLIAAATTPSPVPLNSGADLDLGSDRLPQTATDSLGNWVTVWYSNENLGGTIGTDNDVFVSRSGDDGAAWTAPAALNTNAATDSGGDFNPQVATDGSGNWVAVWYSSDSLIGTIGTDFDILVSRSANNGLTWTAPVALNTNAGTDTGGDFLPTVTTDGLGNWVTAWYSNENLGGVIGTDNDIFVSRSGDDGATWTAPVVLNTNAATDSGSDLNPHVATDGSGAWVAAWYSNDDLAGTIGTDFDILVSTSANSGATWTAPAALNPNAATDTEGDFSPRVTPDGLGNWVAVWYSDDSLGGWIGGDKDILMSRSADGAATWSSPIPLNTNAPTDAGNDSNPQATTDGGGNWISVWDSTDSLGGTIGIDFDILYTTCSPLDADCDEVLDATDNCPNWANTAQGLPVWTVPASDVDCDGFQSSKETFMGTLPLAACPSTTIADDEDGDPWPPDFNDNRSVDIIDIGALRPAFNSSDGDANYSKRLDLTADGFINILDIGALRPFFGKTCA